MSAPNNKQPVSAEDEAEKARKKAEKEARKAAFAAANPDKETDYAKKKQQKQQQKKPEEEKPKEKDDEKTTAAVASSPTPSAAQPAAAATQKPHQSVSGANDDEAEKARKKAEKEARKAAFAAANPDKKTEYEKPKAGGGGQKQQQQQQPKKNESAPSAPAAVSTQQQQPQPPPPPGGPEQQQQEQPQQAKPVVPPYAQPEPLSHLRQLCFPTPLGLGNRTAPSPFPMMKSSSHRHQHQQDSNSNFTTIASISNNPRSPNNAAAAHSPHALVSAMSFDDTGIHPRVAAFGSLLAARCIVGCNARLLGTLDVMSMAACSYVEAHASAGDMRLLTNLTSYLRNNIRFLEGCRPFSSGMRQVTDRLLRELPRDLTVKIIKTIFDEHREELQESIVDTAAGTAKLIQEGDIVLTYGRSSAIEMALCSLCRDPSAPRFSIIVVDAAPHYEGRALLQRLREAGATALSYCMLDTVVTAAAKASKVLLGATAMLPNGQVLGRAGTAMVSIAAKYTRTPVFCVCESYKFTANMWQGGVSNNLNASLGVDSAGDGNNNIGGRNDAAKDEKWMGLDLSACCSQNNNQSNSSQNNNIHYFGGTVTMSSDLLSSMSPLPATSSSSAVGLNQLLQQAARNNNNNNNNNNHYSSSNKNSSSKTGSSILAQQDAVNLSYDLSPPGTVNFVVSEHEVHEPTAIAAVVGMRRGQ